MLKTEMKNRNLKSNIDEQVIDQILYLVNRLNITEVPGYEDINFKRITKSRLSDLVRTELEVLLIYLNDFDRKYFSSNIASDSDVKKYGIDQKRSVVSSTFDRKSEIILTILDLVEHMRVVEVPGYEDIDFVDMKKEQLEELNLHELEFLLNNMENQTNNFDEDVENILQLAKELNIAQIEDLDLDFSSKSIVEDLTNIYSKEDRKFILETLENLNIEEESDHENNTVINPLEVIYKYKNGAIKVDEVIEKQVQKQDETWRKYVPEAIKRHVPSWRTDSLDSIYDKSKELMAASQGNTLSIVREFVCDLSELVFDVDIVEEEFEPVEDHTSVDEVADAILSIVEAIILPYVEVLELIEKRGGDITFANIWSQHFSEGLKKEVKDRDGWKCVVCENNTELHVHHKIPRNMGGVNHKDNLVTLCSSCHGVIETADVNKAFVKCLSNYKKNKNKGTNKYNSKDKTLLREDVENKLDSLLATLNNKDELKLVEDVMDIMEILEVIFYD